MWLNPEETKDMITVNIKKVLSARMEGTVMRAGHRGFLECQPHSVSLSGDGCKQVTL